MCLCDFVLFCSFCWRFVDYSGKNTIGQEKTGQIQQGSFIFLYRRLANHSDIIRHSRFLRYKYYTVIARILQNEPHALIMGLKDAYVLKLFWGFNLIGHRKEPNSDY